MYAVKAIRLSVSPRADIRGPPGVLDLNEVCSSVHKKMYTWMIESDNEQAEERKDGYLYKTLISARGNVD